MRKLSYSVLILIALVALDRLFAGSDAGVSLRSQAPRFTLNDAILTALRQNPTIQIARQEIERTRKRLQILKQLFGRSLSYNERTRHMDCIGVSAKSLDDAIL